MHQYVARPEQEFKSELIVGAGMERVRWTAHDTFNFDGWCSETRTWEAGNNHIRRTLITFALLKIVIIVFFSVA